MQPHPGGLRRTARSSTRTTVGTTGSAGRTVAGVIRSTLFVRGTGLVRKTTSTQHPEHYSLELACQQYHRFPPIKNHFDCKTNQNPYPDGDSSFDYPSTKKTTRKPWHDAVHLTTKPTRKPWNNPVPDPDWDWSSEETDEIYW